MQKSQCFIPAIISSTTVDFVVLIAFVIIRAFVLFLMLQNHCEDNVIITTHTLHDIYYSVCMRLCSPRMLAYTSIYIIILCNTHIDPLLCNARCCLVVHLRSTRTALTS